MLLIFTFLMGVANFAMHKAVIECGHPFVEDTKRYFGRYLGPYGSYTIELALLTGALWLANEGSVLGGLFYLAYTGMNAIATWMLLTGKT